MPRWWPFGQNESVDHRIARVISMRGGAITGEIREEVEAEGYKRETVEHALYKMQREGAIIKTTDGRWWFADPEQPTGGEFGDGIQGDYWPGE